MSELRTADVIAQRLAERGCRYAFGIPGGEVVVLIDALERAGIRFVLTRHETAAAFYAEGSYHATGAPGILVATVGPGIANAVNGIVNAHQDRVPLIVLTGCVDEVEAATYTHQVFDHQAVLRPVTKGTFRVAAGNVDALVLRALALATDGRPGPVHLDVPVGVAPGAATRGRAVMPSVTASLHRPAFAALGRKLALAQRPLILAGLDLLGDPASRPALEALSSALHAPVLTTYKAKGTLDESQPRSLGCAGLSPRADALLLPLVRAADAVVLAGYDPIEMRAGWRDPFGADAFVVDLGAEAPRHGFHRVDEALIGRVSGLCAALAGHIERTDESWPDGAPERVRTTLRDAFGAPGDGPLALVHALSEVLPDDARIAVDTGAHRILFSQAFVATRLGQVVQSSGLCTMGCAVPLAAGLKLASPDRPAIAVVGDGGLDMVLGELTSVRDHGLAIVVVVFDDRALALIELKQRAMGLPEVGVRSGGTDYAMVARALGLRGVRADDASALKDAVREALGADRATVIHCPLDARAYDGRI